MRISLATLALLCATTASAATGFRAEEAAAFADLSFRAALGLGSPLRGWKPQLGPARAVQMTVPGSAGELEQYLQQHSSLPQRDAIVALGSPVTQVSLSGLLNRQWKTPATYTMGGQPVYIGGAFDRQQNAFVSAYVDGWKEPKFFNIKGLLEKEGALQVGSASYSVTLSANVLKPMKSQIVFENKADEEDQSRISVKKLLDSLHAAGDTVKLSDQSYQAFYYNDVVDGASGPSIDPNSKTFAFILMEGEEMHVFLIPAELVLADKIAVFKMFKDKRVGLQTAGDSLKVYENP